MKYNLFLKNNGEFNILEINDDELERFIDTYKYGKESLFLKGIKYRLKGLSEIQIYTFENTEIKTEKELLAVCREQNLFGRGYLGINEWVPVSVLEKTGTRVTDNFIKEDFGYLKDVRIEGGFSDSYVDLKRIDEISNISASEFDFTKLVALLKELNIAYYNGLYFSIPPLVRAIIDHIPPVFSKVNFKEVCGSCGTKSFKENMNILDKSSRKIADSYLHSQIRRNETLPNKTQINFKNDLDVLLQEIVRIMKK